MRWILILRHGSARGMNIMTTKEQIDKNLKAIGADPEDYKPSWEYMKYLGDPNLFNIIINEISKKVEGEEKSKKAIFLSLCSIWVNGSEVPLNSLISSQSSAGKSYLCKNIIKIFPKNLVEYRTKITPEAFTYWHTNDLEWSWDGKICYLEDISQSLLDSQPFKVMCSEGSIATVVIKQKAVDLEINGKPTLLITTATTNPNSEILNRFQIISLDESKEQTEAIVFRIAKDEKSEPYNPILIEALSYLKRKKVKIGFGEKIAFYLKNYYNFDSIRLRRDFSRLQDLIKCSAVLHQYQREQVDGRVIAIEQDYEIAREVINYIQTATFKGLTHKLKKAYDCCKELGEFTATDIHSKFPIVNQKMWYTYLDELCERGMLKTELKKVEDVKKRVTYYSLNKIQVFELPEFKELPKNITINTTDTFNTIDTIDTIDTNVENNCNICNNYNENLSFSEEEIEKSAPECQEFLNKIKSGEK
jgi:hypothetical protein